MDTEISEAIETFRGDLRHLGGRIDTVETYLASRIDRVDAKVDQVDAKIDRVESTLRVDMVLMREDLRTHFDVVAESLRDDVRIIAERLIALNGKVDRLLPPARE